MPVLVSILISIVFLSTHNGHRLLRFEPNGTDVLSVRFSFIAPRFSVYNILKTSFVSKVVPVQKIWVQSHFGELQPWC